MQERTADLRWDDLKTFLAIARGGSLSAAARSLGVNHSTVYRRLEALEASAGVKLFERPDYALTEAGEDALPRALRVEEEVLGVQRVLFGHDQQAAGRISVTLPESMLAIVTPIVQAFRDTAANIDVHLDLSEREFDLGREADVAIRPSPDPPPEAVGRRVANVAWAAYARPDAAPETPWVVYTDVLQGLAAVGWRRRRHGDDPVAFALSSVSGMHAALTSGCGRGMLPCFLGDPNPELVRVGPVLPTASQLWLLVHADLRRAARVRAFVDFAHPALSAQRDLFEGQRG